MPPIKNSSISTIRSQIRDGLIRLINRADPAKVKLAQTKSRLKDATTIAIIMEYVRITKSYLECDPAKTALIASPDERTKQKFNTYASVAATFAELVYISPPLVQHTQLLTEVIQILSGLELTPRTAEQTIDNIRRSLNAYAVNVAAAIEPSITTSSTLLAEGTYGRLVMKWTHMHRNVQPETSTEMKTHTTKLGILEYQMYQSYVPEEVVRYLMNPGVGSAVIWYSDAVSVPFFFNVLPKPYADSMENVMIQRHPSGYDWSADDWDDETQENLERTFSHKAFSKSSDNPLRPCPSADEEAARRRREAEARRQEAEDATRRDEERRHREEEEAERRRREAEAAAAEEDDDEDSSPDDTSYAPNPYLSFKVRRQIERYQSGLDTAPQRDHMTRFETTTESERSIPRSAVRLDDITVTAGRTAIDQRYVVTFTRRNKKPIFNPVSGA